MGEALSPAMRRQRVLGFPRVIPRYLQTQATCQVKHGCINDRDNVAEGN
jgi:hypothetical protein